MRVMDLSWFCSKCVKKRNRALNKLSDTNAQKTTKTAASVKIPLFLEFYIKDGDEEI